MPQTVSIVHHFRKSAPLRGLPPLARNRPRIGRDEELTLAKRAKVAKTRRIVDSLTLGVFGYLSLFPFMLPDLFGIPELDKISKIYGIIGFWTE